MCKQWYAVRTKPRQEEYAAEQFERQGFDVYLPKVMACVRQQGKVVREPRVFFPGYLFLHLAEDERRWTSIRSTYGALDVVHFGAIYPSIPTDFVQGLQARHGEDGLLDFTPGKVVSPFAGGERVVIAAGACEGLEAVFLAAKGEQRALVLLNMLQGQVRAEVALGDLKKA